jgi:predicted alpha/beta hydrolase
MSAWWLLDCCLGAVDVSALFGGAPNVQVAFTGHSMGGNISGMTTSSS